MWLLQFIVWFLIVYLPKPQKQNNTILSSFLFLNCFLTFIPIGFLFFCLSYMD